MCFAVMGMTTVVLLFVLPWFWARLRHVALLGWLHGRWLSLPLGTSVPGHR